MRAPVLLMLRLGASAEALASVALRLPWRLVSPAMVMAMELALRESKATASERRYSRSNVVSTPVVTFSVR